jgi:NADH-quinone oxidoreductase subunit L
MTHAALVTLLAPLVGFLVLVTLRRDASERLVGAVATGAITLSFLAALVTWVGLLHRSSREVTVTLFGWLSTGSLHAPVALLVDPLSVTMMLFVTGVSALIHLYSTGYMQGERDFRKFFAYLNLFVFSMLVLVMADNLVMTFVGWEGVGVCSYWLVAYYFDRDSAASAGKKAFIYNRVGDLGLLIAMFILFSHHTGLGYLQIATSASTHLSGTAATWVVLALLLGASGKSAQIPLFNWLPDAMEGPTPVSALIHAATMVTAGVYLLVRMAPVLALSGSGRTTIAVVGGLTAFVAATIATSQKDIKKVLAFSTISQIGYMVLAVGVGAYGAAIFLMVAHAFFKALLFLGSGSVIHSLHGEQDLRKMGALAAVLPWTYPTFLVGWLAISGLPPFAGFFAKGAVLTGAYAHNKTLWALGVVTAVLTAYYMTRLFVLTFRGRARYRDTLDAEPHESPAVMVAPLVVLAVAATFAGALDLPWSHQHTLDTFITSTVGVSASTIGVSGTGQWTLALIDVVVALLGLLAAFSLWRSSTDRPALEPRFLERVWYWDDLYDRGLGRPLTRVAEETTRVDDVVVDRVVEGVAGRVGASAAGLKKVQTGLVRHYALGMTLGVSLIVVYLVARVG